MSKPLNAIFVTQGASLGMFYPLWQALQGVLPTGKVGFYVSYSPYFRRFRETHPEIERDVQLLKEWEITARGKKGVPDPNLLQAYENKLGAESLWRAIVCDRRLYLGNMATMRQDYTPRFDHARLQKILQEGLVSVERFFDEVQPGVVLAYNCVSFGEYLIYLFARARGIPYLNIRATKIRNYVTYHSDISHVSAPIRDVFLDGSIEARWVEEAKKYLAEARSTHLLYEGTTVKKSPNGAKPHARKKTKPSRQDEWEDLLREEYHYRAGEFKGDNHVPGILLPYLYSSMVTPLRARLIHRRFGKHYLGMSELKSHDYLFFPLHKEPEIALLLYAKAYQNQIELIRTLSHSVPLGMEIVIKEHPRAVGWHSQKYYEKLLAIPNVRLVDPEVDSRVLIENARLVATITGAIGFEALVLGKPVITFGEAAYNILPRSMIRYVTDLEKLDMTVHSLLREHHHREEDLVRYVAAVLSQSVPINFYTSLMGRTKRYASEERDASTEIAKLGEYTVRCLRTYSNTKTQRNPPLQHTGEFEGHTAE